jgi:hypothetical protein
MSLSQLAKISLIFLMTVSMIGTSSAKASDSQNNQTIQINKPVYFATLKQEFIQLKPGNYVLTPLPDSLQVTSSDGTASVQLAITLNTHDQELSEPIAVSVEGNPGGESADRHILALYLPGGFSYTAEETYSGIQSRAVNPQAEITDPGQIYLEKPVHFLSIEGQDQVAKPGRYTVEQADKNIRLVPGEGKDAILVEAQENSQNVGLNVPVALSLPGSAEEEADMHHVVLLLPGGESLEATGTYSGIQSRGFFGDAGKAITGTAKKGTKAASKTVNRAKNTVTRVGRQVTKSPPSFQTLKGTGRELGNAATNTAQDAAKFGEKAALEAKRKAEWVAQQAAKGVQWLGQQACKAGLKTAEVSVKVAGKSLSPALKQVQNLLKRSDMKRRLQQAIDQVKRQLGPSIVQAIEGASTVMDPRNTKVLKGLLKKETMCEKPPSEIKNTLIKMFNRPLKQVVAVYKGGNNSQIRTRGAKPFAVAFGLGGGGGAGVGVDVGARYTTSRFGNTHPPDQWFLDGNLAYATRIGGDGGIVLGFFPNMAPGDTGGSFFAVSIGIEAVVGEVAMKSLKVSKGVGIAFDLIMGPLTDKFDVQGFALSFTVGGSTKSTPIGSGAVKVGYGVGL